jgi:hypothetical protein
MKNPSETKLKAIADKLCKKAKRDELKMTKMYRKDCEDLCAIATLISDGWLEKAYKKIMGLETSVREQIPDSILEFVQNHVQAQIWDGDLALNKYINAGKK